MSCRHRVLSLLGLVVTLAGGPALAVECTTVANNAVSPCGFEDAGAVAAWTPNGGTPAFAAGLGENGGALRGTSANFGSLDAFGIRSPCFSVSPGQVVPLGYAVSLVSGTAPSCTAGWQQWSDAACTAGASGAIGLVATTPGAGYSAVADSRTVGAGVVALSLLIDCRVSGAFEVLIDNAFAIAPQAPAATASVPVPTSGETALLLLALAIVTLAYVQLYRRGG